MTRQIWIPRPASAPVSEGRSIPAVMLPSRAGSRSPRTARACARCLWIMVDLPDQLERELSNAKIGALRWNQYTDWRSLLEAGVRADRLGYDTLWT